MRKRPRVRRAIWTAVALILLLGAGYAYVTRPGAMHARLVALFERFDLRVVQIGEVSFSPWMGLEVRNMQVTASENSPLARQTRVPNAPPLLRVPRARVAVKPWALFSGEFQPREVELDRPTIALIWPEVSGPTPRHVHLAGYLAAPREPPAGLPRLRISNADVEVFLVEDGRLRLQRRWLVNGSGTLTDGGGRKPRAYVLRLDQVAGLARTKHARNPSVAEIRWQAGQLTAALGWVDLEFVQSLLPEPWTQLVQRLQLSGHARVQRIVFDQDGVAAMQVGFDDLRFCVPLESQTEGTPEEYFAQVTDATGVFDYVSAAASAEGTVGNRRGDLRLDVSGRLNGAAADLSVTLFNAAYDAPDGGGQAETLGAKGLTTSRYSMSLRVAGLALPTVAENPRFVSSKRLPGAIRSAFRKYNAEGRVNLELDVWGEPGEKVGGATTVGYRGELEVLGASCRYVGFPYLIDDVRGSLRFSDRDGIVLDGLHGRHGSATIHADGRVTNSKSWSGFELSFRGQNVTTDDNLYTALPPEYRRLWDQAAPVGLCDVQTTLRREHGSAETGILDTTVRVEAQLLSGSLMLLDGKRLENTDGLIHIADGRVELEDLHGYFQGAAARVNGTVSLAADDAPLQYGLRVAAANAALQRSCTVRDGEGRDIGQIRFEGVGDLWGQLSSGEHGQNHYTVHITDGALTGFDAGAPWTQTHGWISVRGDEQRIVSLTASRNDGRLAITGTLPAQLGLDAPIQLDLEAEDTGLERLLRQLVPGRWSNIREALGLGGRGKIAARFYPRDADGERSRQAASIQLEAERMRPTPLPLDLREIKAHVTLGAAGFDLHEAEARYGAEGRLVLSGHGGWAEGSLWSDIQVEGQALDLTPDLVQALPKPLTSLLERLAAQGRIELALDQVLVTGSQQRAWNVVGEVRLKDAKLDVVVPLSDFDGELTGRCEINPDGQLELEAEFAIDRGRLASRPIERWEGHLRCQPGSRRLQLEDVRGRLCEGELVGFGVIDPESPSYELSFTLHDLSLNEFLQREKNKSGRPLPGRLDGHIFVRGDLQDPGKRSGGGELRLRGTSLLSSPVTASVVKASEQQRRAISHEVEHAELRFVWEGQELKLTRVDIHSRDLRLIGMGSWNMRSDAVSMTLLGATPEDAPRLFLLTDLLESAGQELMQYRVDGTAAKPHVTIEPLHNLTDPLRKLLRGDSE